MCLNEEVADPDGSHYSILAKTHVAKQLALAASKKALVCQADLRTTAARTESPKVAAAAVLNPAQGHGLGSAA